MEIDPQVLLKTGDNDLVKVFPRDVYGLSRRELREMKRGLKATDKAKTSTQLKENQIRTFRAFLVKGRTQTELERKFPEWEQLIDVEHPGLSLFVQVNDRHEKVFILLPEVLDSIEILPKTWKYHVGQSQEGIRQPYLAVQLHKPFEHHNKLIVAPLFDVHYGNVGHKREKFLSYIRWIKETKNVYAVVGGDLMENALDDGRGMTYDQTQNPDTQVSWMIKALAPIAHKILVAIPGNHEWRTYKHAGIEPMKVVADRLQIPYFDGPVFLDILADGHRWTCYVSHGYGNSQTKGGKLNMAGKPKKWTSLIHFFVSGHVHDPMVNSETCIVIDPVRMCLTYPQQWTVIAPSFLRWEGTYAYRAGFPPPGSGGVILEMFDNGDYRATLK